LEAFLSSIRSRELAVTQGATDCDPHHKPFRLGRDSIFSGMSRETMKGLVIWITRARAGMHRPDFRTESEWRWSNKGAGNSAKEDTMAPESMVLEYLLASWIAITGILVVLVIYGNALSTREDDELYLNRAEQVMMAAEQNVLISKMNRLLRVIIGFAILSGSLFAATAGLWAWIGLHS
jgi:hypothetical protein